jgi:serine/threonine-protein kinase HipA
LTRGVWRAAKFLRQYGAVRLSLTTAQMTHCIEAVQTATTETAPRVRELADAYPEFREIGKRMLTEWEQGALDITPTVTATSRAGQTLKQSVGLSDAGKPLDGGTSGSAVLGQPQTLFPSL